MRIVLLFIFLSISSKGFSQYYSTDEELFKPIQKDTSANAKVKKKINSVFQDIKSNVKETVNSIEESTSYFDEISKPLVKSEMKDPNTKLLVEDVFKRKIVALKSDYFKKGFETYKSSDLDMHNDENVPIFVDLTKGKLYEMIFVGDPDAVKIELKLAKEDYGNMVTDKFRVPKVGEYWTSFSFIPPVSGQYLITCYQRSPYTDLFGHMAILVKKGSEKYTWDRRDYE